jgi:hypothetical protein
MVQMLKEINSLGWKFQTYEHLGVAPKRNLLTIDEFNEHFADTEGLLIDGGGAAPRRATGLSSL